MSRYLGPVALISGAVVFVSVAIYLVSERRKADAELCKRAGGEIIKKTTSDIGPTVTVSPDGNVQTGVGVVDDVVRYCQIESGELLTMRQLR